jgi:uncharacterized membrane-anchored protein
MRDHELRLRVVGEMHLRKWPLITASCHIIQWVLTVDDDERAQELIAIEALSGNDNLAGNPSHREGQINSRVSFTWERQSEGSSLTLFAHSATENGYLDPTSDPEIDASILWAQSLPGRIVRSTRIWIAASDDDVERLMTTIPFSRSELVSSSIGDGIRMWSDFRIMDDGFGRLLVAANGADPHDLTRQLQRLQELGNYRNKALLGLPVARECWPQLDLAEASLRNLFNRLATNEARDDSLLEDISALALELASVATSISFRMDATRAYGKIVEERLEQLDSRPVVGYASLADFTQRRFRPAMNTCIATTERIARLEKGTEQLASLLRARVDTHIENQNAQLLRSMERSISSQVRLQRLVEGLSVIALSYYLLSLIKFGLHAVPASAIPIPHDALVGVLVIPVLAIVWFSMHILKKRLLGPYER